MTFSDRVFIGIILGVNIITWWNTLQIRRKR